MGRRGPKPQPRHLKLVKGTFRKDRDRPELKPKMRAPAAPKWLSPAALAEWKRIVPELDQLGILSNLDRGILTVYAEAWAQFHEATADIKKNGARLHFKKPRFSRSGELIAQDDVSIANPNVRIRKDAAEMIRKCATDLGLSPAARVGLGGLQQELDDDEDAFD